METDPRTPSPPDSRTKWKRQTLVGMEMISEQNYATLSRLYATGVAGVPAHPAIAAAAPYWPYPGAAHHQNDLFYRQVSVTLQKPLPYRLYPPAAMMLAGPSAPLGSLAASSSLSNLSNLYRDSPEMLDVREREGFAFSRDRSKSIERATPPRNDTPSSIKHESDEESIHDV